MKLGVKSGTVKLEAYTKDWTKAFEKEKRNLLSIFAENYLAIEHIGSTAVTGLVAKPLIDIAIQVSDMDKLDLIPNKLLKLGYHEKVGRLAGRQKVFAKKEKDKITHHLHLIEKGEPDWENKIKFRDLLRQRPKIREQYQELKKDLSLTYPNERAKYTSGKANFIRKLLDESKL